MRVNVALSQQESVFQPRKDIVGNRKTNQVSRRPEFLTLNPNVLCKRLGIAFAAAEHNGAMHF